MFNHLYLVINAGAQFKGFSKNAAEYLHGIDQDGWEGVGVTTLADGSLLLMFKRPAVEGAPSPAQPPDDVSIGFYL